MDRKWLAIILIKGILQILRDWGESLGELEIWEICYGELHPTLWGTDKAMNQTECILTALYLMHILHWLETS